MLISHSSLYLICCVCDFIKIYSRMYQNFNSDNVSVFESDIFYYIYFHYELWSIGCCIFFFCYVCVRLICNANYGTFFPKESWQEKRRIVKMYWNDSAVIAVRVTIRSWSISDCEYIFLTSQAIPCWSSVLFVRGFLRPSAWEDIYRQGVVDIANFILTALDSLVNLKPVSF